MRAYAIENIFLSLSLFLPYLSLSFSYVDNDETHGAAAQACANAACTRDGHVYGTYYPVIRT